MGTGRVRRRFVGAVPGFPVGVPVARPDRVRPGRVGRLRHGEPAWRLGGDLRGPGRGLQGHALAVAAPVLLAAALSRSAMCFVVALVLATLLPDLLFPAPEGHLWITHWYGKFVSKVHVGASAHTAGAWSPWNLLDQSLSGTIFRLSTPVPRQGDMFNVCLWELQAANQRRLTLGLELLIAGWLAWCTSPRRRTTVDGEPHLAALAEIGMVLCQCSCCRR